MRRQPSVPSLTQRCTREPAGATLVFLEHRNCQKLAHASRNGRDAQPLRHGRFTRQNPPQSFSGNLARFATFRRGRLPGEAGSASRTRKLASGFGS
jgi:hypothetical protein